MKKPYGTFHFWNDRWVGDSTLRDSFQNIFSISLKQDASVANCRNDEMKDRDLSLCRGLFGWEVDGWLDLIQTLDAVCLGEAGLWERMGSFPPSLPT